MAFTVGTVQAEVGADISSFNRSMKKVRANGLAAVKQVSQKMRTVGRSLTMSLTAPMAAFGAAAVKSFADFDSAMTQSTAIMSGVTEDVRRDMEQAAKSISQELTVTSTEAANSYFYLASAGLDAKQSIAALPQVAKFAQAGMFDMATATDLATDAQSALGLTVDDAADNMRNLKRVTDVLVKANTLANASVQKFSESLTNRAAAAMRSANKEVEEGVAVLAAFADQGMKGQMAGEQFARILRILSQEADKNKELFSDLGIIDAEGNLVNMADIIEILSNEMAGLSDSAKSAKLEQLGFTARVQAAIKPLLGTSDAIREYERGLRNAAGTTAEVANNQMKSLTSQTKILWNTIVNAGQAIGKSFVEAFDIQNLVKQLQSGIASSIKWFNTLSDEVKRGAFVMAGVLGASGPVLLALGTMSAAIGALISPIGAVIAAVAGIGAAFVAIAGNWEAVKERVSNVTWWRNTLIRMVQLLVEYNPFSLITKGLNKILSRFGSAQIPNLFENVADGLGKLRDDTVEYETEFKGVWGTVQAALENTTGLKFNIFDDNDIEQTKQMGIQLATVSSEFSNLKTSITGIPQQLDRVTEAGELTNITLEGTTEKAKVMGQALQSTVTNAVSSFATTLGNAFTGDAGAKGFFNNLIAIAADFANQFGKLLIAAGTAALAFENLLANPIAAIAAGAALIAASTAVKNLLKEGPSQKVNDALITSSGKVVEFHPDDNILAMKDFGKLRGNDKPKQNISPTMLERAFGRALDMRLQRLGNDEIYAMAQKGKRSY